MVILFYSKFMNHSQKEHRTSALIDNVEKKQVVSQWSQETETFSARHSSHLSPPCSQLYSLAYNIFVKGRHFSHSNCSVDASLFYTSPTGKEGVAWHKLNSEMCVFSGLSDLCRDLTILTWS